MSPEIQPLPTDQVIRQALKMVVKEMIREIVSDAAENQLALVSGSNLTDESQWAYDRHLVHLGEILSPIWVPNQESRI